MNRGRAAGLGLVAAVPLGGCVGVGLLIGGDPMLVVEVIGGGVISMWIALVILDLVATRRRTRTLSAGAREVALFGVACTISPALGHDALVVGTIRPRIVLGDPLLSALSNAELEAVVYHEDHHRRTRAPLRAAALGAWLRLFGRFGRVRSAVIDRMADLESLADAEAIRRGSKPSSLARALLKGDLSRQPVAFSYAADRRVQRLLDRADGVQVDASTLLPYEWLPVAVLAAVTIACHIGL